MIESFRHKGLERYFETGSKAKIQPKHADKIRLILGLLDAATTPDDMTAPGLDCHKLTGDLAGSYAVSVSGNWRITFGFDGENAVDVDYLDYQRTGHA